MFQGTGSDVGKSLMVAGLARALTNAGWVVRPFKPQNMSNNAAVTLDGGEIGRAQALQARACRCGPSVDMNPVLLKPQSDIGAQVIVAGRVLGNAKAREYQRLKGDLLPSVLESYERLRANADIVLVEGAGSASEVNLRAGDIANMGFAQAVNLPVVLVGDIDRGGVIASICGTHQLVSDAERALLKGYIINKFRGDPSLFDDAIGIIDSHTALPCLGVVPWFDDADKLPAEDSVSLMTRRHDTANKAGIKIAVPMLPRIANFDDFDPLIAEADVELQFVSTGEPLPGDADAVILPGSKSTIADLEAFYDQGWDVDLAAHMRRGGTVLGICGGYQMLGRSVADPQRFEGERTYIDGLGLLDVHTELVAHKRLSECQGVELASGASVQGFEMHMGRTDGPDRHRPMLRIEGQLHGACSLDGRVMGCYLHGLFASDAFRETFLRRIDPEHQAGLQFERTVDETLDALADHLTRHIDVRKLIAIAGATKAATRPAPVIPQANTTRRDTIEGTSQCP
ncbi:MAG: cobyric acid synthase [Pseudomonadota bacterium]